MPGLHLSALTLSHFRSHKGLALALDERPVALFGPNGAGKTNILEAISLLSPGRGLRRAVADDLARRPERLGWRIDAMLEAQGQSREVALRAESGASRSVRIDGKAAPQAALGRIAPILWLVPSMDRLWTEAAEGRRRFLDRIAMGFDPAHAEASLRYDRAMRERNRLLRDEVRDDSWYMALETTMAASGRQITAARHAALARIAAAEDAASRFPVAGLTLTGGEAGALADLLAAGRARDMAAGRTLSGPHRADLTAVYRDKGVAAAQCSTGEQKALLISVVLATARALADGTGVAPLLLLDEVAAHLDAARRVALYDEICALGAQAWMTGTGAELFTDLGDRVQRFAVTETGGESRVEET